MSAAPSLRNVRVLLAYDGSLFYGWQRQDGFESVQEALEDALESLLGERIVVRGSGRTDTGVHALGQVAHFHVETKLSDDRLRHALNAHLVDGILVRRLETCRDDFHAQYDARGKRYFYLTLTERFRPPFGQAFAHWVRDSLDLGEMRRAAAALVGEHDFSAFCNAGSPRADNVRHLRSVHILARRQGFAIVVEANGFLYNMVRAIAGTLIEVGRARMSADDIGDILAQGERGLAGPTAPACGLYLLSVRYPETCFAGPDRGPHGSPGLFGAPR